jgi:hypothetical protein
MSNFKIGDVVTCVNGDNYLCIDTDKYYTIENIKCEDNELKVKLKNAAIDFWYPCSLFKKVESCKENPFDYFEKILIFRKNKSVELIKNGCSIKVYNDLTPEGGKRIELWNVITYHNDKCEIADENMRKAIECACEIYDMIFKA